MTWIPAVTPAGAAVRMVMYWDIGGLGRAGEIRAVVRLEYSILPPGRWRKSGWRWLSSSDAAPCFRASGGFDTPHPPFGPLLPTGEKGKEPRPFGSNGQDIEEKPSQPRSEESRRGTTCDSTRQSR